MNSYRYDYTYTWTLLSRSLPVPAYCSSRADFRFLAPLTGAILSGVIPRVDRLGWAFLMAALLLFEVNAGVEDEGSCALRA